MANKSIFKTANRGKTVPQYNAVNEAGGRAYNRTDEGLVAQYVVTGTLNGTFYASADEQVDTLLQKAGNCSSQFLACAAVYARKTAKMKDTPALLGAILATRGEEGIKLLEAIFDRIIDNQKQLRNFVQILRSGRIGRKSFGTAIKRMIQNWLRNQETDQLFYQSVGNDPSLADVVKMVHVKPANKEQEAFYGWLLGRKHNKRYLPKLVKAFEKFKSGESKEVPAVDFRMLTALDLTTDQWKEIGRKAGWNMVRMNLNTFQRHGCFDDREFTLELAAKLADENAVRKSNAFPYQLLTTFQAVEGQVPVELSNAVQDAMETATENVPVFDGDVAVCVDTSGSMHSPATGYRAGSTSKTKCVDVAGLVAASVLRKNPRSIVVPFDTDIRLTNRYGQTLHINPRDSVMTNAKKFIECGGGGTDCACALRYINGLGQKFSAVIYVSDNESWYRNSPVTSGGLYLGYHYSRGTSMAEEWAAHKVKNPKSKLVCIDIQPNRTVQVPDEKDVLNIGGFSDSVFTVAANFINGDSRDFVKVIRDAVDLDK
jgi:60 kDa SS-A/Ro ribonucleoprotein